MKKGGSMAALINRKTAFYITPAEPPLSIFTLST